MELKEKLVALRKEKGLTQLAVAEKLDVSRQAISRWESGITLPSTDNLKSLSALYGVPVDYLLNSDTEREDNRVQTDMNCGEQTTPQKKVKRRIIIGFAMRKNIFYSIFYWVMTVAICMIICLNVNDRGYYIWVTIAITSFIFSYLTERVHCSRCGKTIHQKWQNFKYCPYCRAELNTADK